MPARSAALGSAAHRIGRALSEMSASLGPPFGGKARGPGDLLVEHAAHPRRACRRRDVRVAAAGARQVRRVALLVRRAEVRRDRREVEEERPGGAVVLRHELARELAQHVGLVLAAMRVVDPAVHVEERVHVVVGAARAVAAVRGPRDRAVPVGPAVGDVAERRLAGDLGALRAVPVEVLPDEAGLVAARAQRRRERRMVVEGLEAVGAGVREDMVVVGVAAGQERRAGRAAQRVRAERVAERRAPSRPGVDGPRA